MSVENNSTTTFTLFKGVIIILKGPQNIRVKKEIGELIKKDQEIES